MEHIEVLSMLGYPARLAGRIPIAARYLWVTPEVLFATSDYARERYGPTYRLRPWLRLDTAELEQIEHLINDVSDGADEKVLQFRQAQLASGGMTTVVGSLLAAACATMLTLESVSDVNLTVRAGFTVSLMLSLMSVYFTLVQQRELSLPTSAETLRRWLWNGRLPLRDQRESNDPEAGQVRTPKQVKESSLTSNILLQAPFELLSIAISIFLGALAAYLGLVMLERVELGTGHQPNNEAVLIAFLVCTAFTLVVFGRALGQKDREKERCERVSSALASAAASKQPCSGPVQQPYTPPQRDLR